MIRNEALGACPVCGAVDRRLLHAALADDSFRAVDGTWALWRCAGCGNAHLDPRPDRATIGEAYRRYYTHAPAAPALAGPPAAPALAGPPTAPAPAGPPAGPAPGGTWAAPPSWRARLRLRLEAAYLHQRYGAPGPAAWPAAALYTLLLPHRWATDVRLRHLPGPGRGRRLLDVGCGDGGFLRLAQACGWQVEGVDPDPQAVAEGRRQGLPLQQGGLEAYAGQAGCFDHITLSHVIEHVHDPAAMLADCHRLLRPGGRLWIATPNLDAAGHARHGRFWRGLEAPRHLVLFHEAGLRRLLAQAGFGAPRRHRPAFGEPFVLARASHAMSLGLHPHDAPPPLPPALQRAAARAAWAGLLWPARREFIYLSARRPP